ncbi:MAG TPA: hypothetical protein VGF67_26080 [Ktedonobacteraceae bacterium]
MATVLEMSQDEQKADGGSFLSQFEPLLQAIATIAQGDTSQRDEIEEMLTELEAEGWHLKAPVRRLWTAGLDEQDTSLVVRIGEILAVQRDTGSDLDGERS